MNSVDICSTPPVSSSTGLLFRRVHVDKRKQECSRSSSPSSSPSSSSKKQRLLINLLLVLLVGAHSSSPVRRSARTIKTSKRICSPSKRVARLLYQLPCFAVNHDQGEMTQMESKVKELKSEIGPLSRHNAQYCTDACFRRYLEARNWNMEKSKKMLEETLKWRSTYKPEEILWREIASEGETGKVYRASFHDRLGRSVLILRPGKQNTKSIDNQIRHLVYLIENAILNLPEKQEQMSWLIDFTGWSLSNNPSIKSAQDTINILQNHYPERLGIAILYNPPRIFKAFWKVVKYFLDAKTFQKVKFVYPKNKDSVGLMRSLFDKENLPAKIGGKATLQYDHEEFSKLMTQDEVAPEPLAITPLAT